jgi:hypothetical protein
MTGDMEWKDRYKAMVEYVENNIDDEMLMTYKDEWNWLFEERTDELAISVPNAKYVAKTILKNMDEAMGFYDGSIQIADVQVFYCGGENDPTTEFDAFVEFMELPKAIREAGGCVSYDTKDLFMRKYKQHLDKEAEKKIYEMIDRLKLEEAL